MAEYIERESLLKQMEGYCSVNCGHEHGEDPLCPSCFMNDAIILVEDQPAADVQPVKHGKWIYNKPPDDWIMSLYTCSICRNLEDGHPDYCPNCGADMRGIEDGKTN